MQRFCLHRICNMTTELSHKLQSANVLMTFFIVVLHSNMSGIYPITLLTDVAVPTFFCISSFLYFQNWQNTWTFYTKKIRSRIRSLLIPYIAYNCIYYIIYLIKIFVFKLPVSKDIPLSPWDAFICIINSVPDGPLWFIKALMLFVLIAPIFAWIVKIHKSSIIFLTAIGIVIAQYSDYATFLYWIPCFSLGCFFALYQKEITFWYNYNSICLFFRRFIENRLVLLVLFAICSYIFYRCPTDYLYYYLYRIITPLGILCLYIKNDPIPNRLTQLIHPFTFYAFGIHDLFIWNIHGLLRIQKYVTEDEVYPIEFIIILFCTLLLIYATGLILKKTPRVWSILTGYRNNFK